MNYPPYNPDPNDPHAQPTVAGQYPQWGRPRATRCAPLSPQWEQQPGQPSSPQWSKLSHCTSENAGQPSYPQWGQQPLPPYQQPTVRTAYGAAEATSTIMEGPESATGVFQAVSTIKEAAIYDWMRHTHHRICFAL